ncbi:hypothetical protein O181_019928 [Austropuccinia psidii MF-1]|uniref:Uncharacterized protein n=1 Tax=Austropuccinia psidii MF-1 TaxID=1389203 RepID=A0A9Q3CAI6_9BASI|nr:hypothetical protein [Austropuccinia psidii MF-1]
MDQAQKPAMALNWAPTHHPRPSLQYWGRSGFYGPGPSQWAQAIWKMNWSIAIFMVPWTPWKSGLRGSNNPHRPQSVGHIKDCQLESILKH